MRIKTSRKFMIPRTRQSSYSTTIYVAKNRNGLTLLERSYSVLINAPKPKKDTLIKAYRILSKESD